MMMQRQQSFQNNKPTLFLVATPIGNLTEMTPRAIDTLNKVDVIACEDTRNTVKLLSHFQIKTHMITHHRYNEYESAQGIIKLLKEKKDVALLSDAGFPLVCDPGSLLTQEVIKAGFNVVVINGSTALLSALVASGIAISPFYFHGFLAHNNNDAKKQLEDLVHYSMTLVFYESVHRIKRTLSLMLEVFGNREICLARELTKMYEEYIRGNIEDIVEIVDDLKGEFVIVVTGKKQAEPDVALSDLQDLVQKYVNEGYSASEAIKMVAKEAKISKNKLYQYIHQA